MQISEIEVVNLHFSYPNRRGFRYGGGSVTGRITSLVRVFTDAGLEGLGSVYSHPDLVRIIVEKHLKPHLLGSDPTNIDRLWRKMYQLTRWYGRKGVALSALGGIDIALWDLQGKAVGQPVYKLLGGTQTSVPAYASALFWQDDPRMIENEAARHRDRGFRRVKMRLGRGADYDRAAVEAACRGVGQDGEVIVDGSHQYTLDAAESMAEFLADRKVFWFEEPFPPEDLDSYIALRSRELIPIAAGENEFGVQGFRELLRAKAIDIVQPDACRTGGISESMRIGRMAAQNGNPVAPHTWSDAVALIANAHVVAALPNSLTVEVDQTGNPFIEQLLATPLLIEDGLLQLPEGPGLGISLNMEEVRRLAMEHEEEVSDGNYSDLIFGAEYWIAASPGATPIRRKHTKA